MKIEQMEQTIVKAKLCSVEYQSRRVPGKEILEQEVYGIDPYTHNIPKEIVPADLDWSIDDKAEEKKGVNESGDEDKINKDVAVKTNFMMANIPGEAKFYLAQLYMVGRDDRGLKSIGLRWDLPPWPGFCALVYDHFAQHSDYKVLGNSHSVKQYNHSVLDCTDKIEDGVHFHMKQDAVLYNLEAQMLPKSHHGYFIRLTLEYFKFSSLDADESSACKYVILSKNVLAVFVVMNSTVSSSNEPGNIVFHTLSYAQNLYAMNLWFAEKARMEYLSLFGHLHFLFLEIFKDLNRGLRSTGLLWNLPPWPDLSLCEADWMANDIEKGAAAMCLMMAAMFGGIVGQVVVQACSGKFHPVYQFFYFDSVESLPVEPLESGDLKSENTRYIAQISVLRSKLRKILEQAKIFMVGSGALGCEVLKNLALMGISCSPDGKLTVTDDDVIEKSNLSRQFLFHDWNSGQPKSTVAATVVMAINLKIHVEALQNRASPETENVFNEAFWENLDVVINALGNVTARVYVDSRCVYFQKPLPESGILGAKSNTRMIIPHITENYGASRDPTEKQAPMCTVHSFPHNIDHCLTWARSEFEGLLEKTPTEVNAFLSRPTGYEATSRIAGDKQARDQLERVIEGLHEEKCETFQDCITWARLKFEDYFSSRMKHSSNKKPRVLYTSAQLVAMEVWATEYLRRLLRRSGEALFLLQLIGWHNVARWVQLLHLIQLLEATEVSVYDYFVKSWGIELRYSGDLPFINVGKLKRPTYFPIELCSLVPLQRYTKALSTLQRSSLVEKSRQKLQERMSVLYDVLLRSNYDAELVLKACGISIAQSFTQVGGRLLQAPKLKAGDGEDIFTRNGQWNFNNKRLIKANSIEKWTVINFSARCNVRNFVRVLIKCGGMKGIKVDQPCDVFEENPSMRRAPAVKRGDDMFEQIKTKFPGALKCLLCALAERKKSDVYGPWKRKCLAEFGIVTQGVASTRVNDQYLTNVLLRINAELDGKNSLLQIETSPAISLVSKVPTIILGMDVFQGPPGQSDVPSIAAVVSSREWPLISKYRTSVRSQSPKLEMMDSLFKPQGTEDDGLVRELLIDFYTSSRRGKPALEDKFAAEGEEMSEPAKNESEDHCCFLKTYRFNRSSYYHPTARIAYI